MVPLDRKTVEIAMAAGRGVDHARVIHGDSQTDFVPAGIDKGVGLGALARMLRVDGSERRIRLAMGDTLADVPMFGLAQEAYLPSNGHPAARVAGVKVTSKPFGAGVFQAAAKVLGHAPGGCALCAAHPVPPEENLLMLALSGQAQNRWGRIATVLQLERRRRPSARRSARSVGHHAMS